MVHCIRMLQTMSMCQKIYLNKHKANVSVYNEVDTARTDSIFSTIKYLVIMDFQKEPRYNNKCFIQSCAYVRISSKMTGSVCNPDVFF